MSKTFYHRIIRKLVVGFGNLFNDITLVRYNPDLTEAERFLVPIAYATKEKYVMRLEEDFNLDKKVQMTLPRISFEMTGFAYDASRKHNTNVKNFAQTSNGLISQYNPVPYNFDFSIYIYVRNIEDGTQIIEHILPYFTPDYTIKLNMIPEMGIIKEVPVILNSTTQDIQYEGNRDSDPRLIIWTLNFTVKAFIFGATSTANVVTHSITSILNQITPEDAVQFVMDPNSGVGNYQVGENVYQGYTASNAVAMGKVVTWTNNNLVLTNINGNFVSSEPVYGLKNGANYKFVSYSPVPFKYAQIDAYAAVEVNNTKTTVDTIITIDNTDTTSTTIIESPNV
jgi:hypothetical protein